jgi:hypothetical protein
MPYSFLKRYLSFFQVWDHPFKTSAFFKGGRVSPLPMFADSRGVGISGILTSANSKLASFLRVEASKISQWQMVADSGGGRRQKLRIFADILNGWSLYPILHDLGSPQLYRVLNLASAKFRAGGGSENPERSNNVLGKSAPPWFE